MAVMLEQRQRSRRSPPDLLDEHLVPPGITQVVLVNEGHAFFPRDPLQPDAALILHGDFPLGIGFRVERATRGGGVKVGVRQLGTRSASVNGGSSEGRESSGQPVPDWTSWPIQLSYIRSIEGPCSVRQKTLVRKASPDSDCPASPTNYCRLCQREWGPRSSKGPHPRLSQSLYFKHRSLVSEASLE